MSRNPAIGKRIRDRREELGLTQSDLSQAVGVTRAQISNLERGVSSPSFRLLLGLEEALGIAVSELLREEPLTIEHAIVGPEDRHRVVPPYAHGAHIEQLAPFVLGKMDPREVVLQPLTGRMQGHAHRDDEWLLVLEGSLELYVADQVYVLEEGDSVFYKGHTEHAWLNTSLYPTRLLWLRVTGAG